MTTVVDFYGPHEPSFYQCLRASGASGVARYLTASRSDPRELTSEEVAAANAAGLAVYVAYEMNPTRPEYFTFAQGAEDCRRAQDRLADLGAPDGTVVYFTVDVNIDPNLTVEYFNGVESAVTPRIVPGCYGYQVMCEFAFEHFPIVGKHLWQTYGTPTVPLDLWQHLQEDRCGVEVDVNEASAPGWRAEGADEMTDPERAILDKLASRPDVVAALIDGGDTVRYILHGANDQGPGSYGDTLERVAKLEGHTAIPAAPVPAPTSPAPPPMPPIFAPGHGPQ